MKRAGLPAPRRCSYMHSKLLILGLLLAAAVSVLAFDRVVVLEDAYAEY
jgi:hypothetical protein